jgi:hypothetical protein
MLRAWMRKWLGVERLDERMANLILQDLQMINYRLDHLGQPQEEPAPKPKPRRKVKR